MTQTCVGTRQSGRITVRTLRSPAFPPRRSTSTALRFPRCGRGGRSHDWELVPHGHTSLPEGGESEDVDAYTRFEFGGDGAWLRRNGSGGAPRSRIDLNGGRSGWMGEARRAGAEAAGILPPPRSPRVSPGRTAPHIPAPSAPLARPARPH